MTSLNHHFFSLPIIVALMISGCASGPGALQKNRQLMPSHENAIPQKALQQHLHNLKGRYPVTENKRALKQTRKIVQRLNTFALENSANEWNVTILKNKRPFACILPPHHIVIFSGILRYTPDDVQLSALIAHLMAHQQALHGNDRYRNAVTRAEAQNNLSKSDLEHIAITAYTGKHPENNSIAPFSEAHENLADRLSVLYMARAGYPPDGALKFWNSFEHEGADTSTPLFVKVHPVNKSRLANLKQVIKRTKTAQDLTWK